MKNLKKKREKLEIPQWVFADMMGVTPRTVRNWESGKQEIRKGYLPAIKRILG